MPEKKSPNFLTCPIYPTETPSTQAPVSLQYQDKPEPPPKIEPPAPAPVPPKRVGRKILGVILTLIIVLILIATVPAGIAFGRAYFFAQSAKSSLNQARDNAKSYDMTGVKRNLLDAQQALASVRDALRGVGFWRDVPGVGTQIRALEDAASAGSQTLDGAGDLADIASIVTDALNTGVDSHRSFKDLSQEEKRDLVAKFSNALPDLRLAREKVDIAYELWSRVHQDELAAPIRSGLKPLADNLPLLKQTLDEAVPLIEALVPLAGYPNKVTYLVALQNSDEMRPGGGFIGNIGTITVDSGDLTKLAFTDVYNIDNPASYAWKEVPPAPIAERLGVKSWYLRDANWSPDFPTSAERILDFYTREYALDAGKPKQETPNAYLALEPGFFKSLLRLTGPVSVDGKTYTEANFFDILEYQVEQGFAQQGIPLENRKDVIEHLGTAIIEKLKAFPSSRWGEIVDLMTTALSRKQIMAYARDPELLRTLDDRGWTGRAKATNGDFLWVVDANLAALKTDGVMDKSVSYSLDASDPQKPLATVTLTYKNTNRTITWRYTRYRSYTRILVPEGSQLISSSGAMKDDLYKTGNVFVSGKMDVTKELGKTAFGAFWSIEPGRTGTLSFTYQLPPSAIGTDTYHLDFQKQPGADTTALTLALKFGKKVVSAVPSESQDKWGDAQYEYQTDSLLDRMFDIKF